MSRSRFAFRAAHSAVLSAVSCAGRSAACRVALPVALAVVLSACSGGGQPGAAEGTPAPSAVVTVTNELPPTPTPEPIPDNAIKVGILLDTGGQDQEGLDSGNVMSTLDRAPAVAFEAQINAINEAGGILGRPVAIIKMDTTSRLSVIDRAAEDMIDAGVDMIVVTCEFDFAAPAIRRAEEAGVLVISPCASETGWTTGAAGELAFSLVPPVATYGRAMAEFMWAQEYRAVAVISDQSAPEARTECEAFSSRWRELGGTFVYSEAFTLRAADAFEENVNVRRAIDADAIAFCAFSTIGKKLLGADGGGIRSIGIDAPIVAGPSFDTGTWLPLDFPGLGVFRQLALSSVYGDDPSPRHQGAMEGFARLDSTNPASGRFVLGADVADLWAQAVEAAGVTDGEAVAVELRRMVAVPTISGTVTFGGSQAPESRQLRVLRHSNGRLVYDTTIEATQVRADDGAQ
jgi:branched-chain amino acid transport system substrate-binding protein